MPSYESLYNPGADGDGGDGSSGPDDSGAALSLDYDGDPARFAARFNDPELDFVLPGWGEPAGFDAENGVGQLRQAFETVEVERWNEPLVRLADRAAVALYLRGRGLAEDEAAASAGRVAVPVTLTKRGMVAWCRRS